MTKSAEYREKAAQCRLAADRAFSPLDKEAWLQLSACSEIDKRVERHRELLRSTTEPAEIERIKRLIAKLYAERVLLHQNPEK
jgi:hypothetical protein